MGKYEKTWCNYLIYKIMGKYTTKYDTLKLQNKTCYTIPKVRIMTHKALGHWPQWKQLDIERKSYILDHTYQFSIRKYDTFIMNRYHTMAEKRAYLLSKRWWQSRRTRNVLGCNKSLKMLKNKDRIGMT